jgi:RimJ/RimL family protein N-acetyltransferase
MSGFALRPLRAADRDIAHRLVMESLDHLLPWMTWAAGYDLDASARFVEQVEAGWANGHSYSYLILDGPDPAGLCALHRSIGPGGLEIGYWLHPDHTGRGLATRATAALVGHAFSHPDIDHVQIWHDAANVASAAVPKRLGFTQVDRRTPPRDPLTPGEVGIDVVWQLDRLD